MPSAYTSYILNGKVTDLKGFAQLCARAFGACIEQRDDPLDASLIIPEPKPKDVSYENKRVKNAKRTLARLLKYTEEQRVKYGQKEKNKIIKHAKKRIKERLAIREKLEKVKAQVIEWQPPTKDHEGLKKFMLEQIDQTIDFDADTDYYEREIREAEEKNLNSYHFEAIDFAKHDIEYYTKKKNEELNRVDNRREWVVALLNSLETK